MAGMAGAKGAEVMGLLAMMAKASGGEGAGMMEKLQNMGEGSIAWHFGMLGIAISSLGMFAFSWFYDNWFNRCSGEEFKSWTCKGMLAHWLIHPVIHGVQIILWILSWVNSVWFTVYTIWMKVMVVYAY